MNSRATVGRFPSYLFILRELSRSGFEYISATILAEHVGVESISVRKDLAITGVVGKPKIGFHVESLIKAIEEYIGWDQGIEAILVGVGSLGSALLNYDHFHDHKVRLVAGFDVKESLIGTNIKGTPIYSIDQLGETIKKLGVKLGVIALPPAEVSKVATVMMDAGIVGIWSFAPAIIPPRKGVVIQYEDIASGLAILSMQVKRQENPKPKIKIEMSICMGSSCFSRGGSKYITFLEEYIKENDLSDVIDLVGNRCTGNCTGGPNITINGVLYQNITTKQLMEIIESKMNE